ncbi:hypothetical protein DP939_37420 [Spongiactinospora rosea]|uniref:Secreted protein n=1 Tax=Spongiactinospora rosea TaxID=2248750 RepID=A0A366LP76_9ACTN|nr:hypothetical protein [Spongiactinospora rosea]RBQ15084.1 hypothetical protein DP939_37420 [Spongiactinospora rosea]
MRSIRKSTMLAASIAAGLLTILPAGVANAAPAGETYPECELFFDQPSVVDGKVRFTGGAKCASDTSANVGWLLVWLTPHHDAPYKEAVGEKRGRAKTLTANSTVPCVSGNYQGSVFATVTGDKGVEHLKVDTTVPITC